MATTCLVDGIRGHLNKEDCVQLFNMGKNLPDHATVIEIGSLRGLSSYMIYKGTKQAGKSCRIFCIDLWDPENLTVESGIPDKHILDDAYNSFLSLIIDRQLPLIPLRGHSDMFASCFEKESIDFIFIDGDHSYAQTKHDLENYFPLLKKEGVCYIHDCMYKSNVNIALYDFSKTYKIKIKSLKNTHGMFAIMNYIPAEVQKDMDKEAILSPNCLVQVDYDT